MHKQNLLFLIVCTIILSSPSLRAQNLIFAADFNNSLQSSEGENPINSAGISFTNGVLGEGIQVESGDRLQYDLSNNINAQEGNLSLWVQPNWSPGQVLHRIIVVESSPVFEMHVDESASLVFAMFSDQIEARVALANVSDWAAGDWHFVSFNWSAEKIEIFVDGNQVLELSVGFEIPAFQNGNFQLGSLNGTNPFDGVLDDIKIYDAPLSDTQVSEAFETAVENFPKATAVSISDIFGRDVTQTGITLVDWEGPIRNPAMKYYLKGDDALSYPITVKLSTSVEQTSFSLPSTISTSGPTKNIFIESEATLDSFLFSFYMDENFEEESFDLQLSYTLNGLPVRQLIPVRVIDQDRDRPLSYPVTVDFSEAIHPLMVAPETQSVIKKAAEDWLYYIDGEGIDEIPTGGSSLDIGGQDHLFEEKTARNPVPYKGYYLFAYGNTNPGPCVCSTGSPNRELLQTSGGQEVPIFRIGALHLNVFGQAFETEPTGWEILSPYEQWTQQGFVGTDIYTLAKHEIGHAMVFENSPLFLKAQGRDPGNPFPDESITPIPNGFTSPALTAYYPDEVVPLFANSLSHVIDVLDPASQVPPYGGGVLNEVMPNGREMMTKLDILIMESVGYPLRENEVTRALAISSEDDFRGDLEVEFSANLTAVGGIPVYDFTILDGVLPNGLTLDSNTGSIVGTPEEEGEFPISFQVKDYDERSLGATFETTIRIGIPLSSAAELLSFKFDPVVMVEETRIDTLSRTIYFRVAPGMDYSSLIPQIEISERATISPAINTPQDFSNPVVYTVTSEDGNVSVEWTIVFELISSTDQQLNQNFSIYPNPANKELYVEVLGQNPEALNLQLFNLQGQMVGKPQVLWQTARVSLQDISAGLYLLKISDQSGAYSTHQIVVEH